MSSGYTGKWFAVYDGGDAQGMVDLLRSRGFEAVISGCLVQAVRPNWPTRAEAERPWAGTGITDFEEVRVGQVLIAHGRPYPGLTEGKAYTVVGYQPRDVTPSFTFPPYITVIGDHGTPVTAHCHRFRLPEEKHETA